MSDVLVAGAATVVWESLTSADTLLVHPEHESALVEAARDIQAWSEDGIDVTTVLDPPYPQRLLAVHQAPPVLFTRGAVLSGDRAVSVVGSRKTSDQGVRLAGELARALVRSGFTVLSGLAAGVDTAAHVAALDEGGRTVAVIGTGIRRYFPAENRDLQDAIAERGLLVSQFWPDTPPGKHTFPMRNATMSGYGQATVVVEAGEQSGARIQARVAVEHGRPVILTRPVVDANEWARQLLGRPGVHQADGVEEIMAVIRSLEDQEHVAIRARTAALTG